MFDPKDIYERIMKLKRAAEESREEYKVLMDKIRDTIAEIAILHLNAIMRMSEKSEISPGVSMLATLLAIENLKDLLKNHSFAAEIYDRAMRKMHGKIELGGNA